MFKWTKYDGLVLPSAFIIIILTAIGLFFILDGKKTFLRKLPLRVLAVVIVLLEIAKQIYFNCFAEYTTYVLPLHFCSLFIILLPLSQLFGEKVGRIFKPMAFIYSILVLILVLVNPRALLGDLSDGIFANFHNFHAFFYHFTVIAYFIFSVVFNDYLPKLTDCINVCGGVVIYISYAIPCAYHLNTNYVNILYSDFEPLEKFRLFAGQVWYDIVLFLIAIIAMCTLCISYYFISKLKNK